jgi:hypothetical protein
MKATGALALAGLALAGGARSRTELIGFPVVQSKTAEEAADRLQVGLQEIEREIGAGATAGPAAPTPASTIASRRLLDAYVALANDDLKTNAGFSPFDSKDRRQPLFLYPRLTFPHLAECSTTPDPADPAKPGERSWWIPVLLNRGALASAPRWKLLTGRGVSHAVRRFMVHPSVTSYAEVYRRIGERLRPVLVPRGEALENEIPLDTGQARWHSPRPVKIGGPGHPVFQTPFELPLGRPDAIDLVFEIPVSAIAPRWQELARKTGRKVAGELFDFRLYPRIPFTARIAAPDWQAFVDALGRGQWLEAHRVLTRVHRDVAAGRVQQVQDVRGTVDELHRLAGAVRQVGRDLEWFQEMLEPIAGGIDDLAAVLPEREYQEQPLQRLRDLLMAVGRLLEDDLCPAPVFLDEPDPKDRSWSFIVGADLQYDTDASCLQQFLTLIDGTTGIGGSPYHGQAPSALSPEEARGAKFIVIAGDLGDGDALSSNPSAALGDALGLSAPKSPYAEHTATPRTGEFPELRSFLRRSRFPVFVVPGNHDGFVSYGGVLNQLTLLAGRVLNWLPLVGFLGDPFVAISDDLPTLIKLWRVAQPFYDGLFDWVYELGPRNVAFHYRGSTFLAVNSFDLTQYERDQVGALGNNWGGGLQDCTLTWIDAALRHFSSLDRRARGLEDARGTSFLFMHHDPRGGLASKNGYLEKDFGHYNDLTAPLNELTFGWFGTASSIYTQIWLPILTPIATGAIRAASYGENFQERWMRKTAWDEECYNAKGLLDVIHRNLEGAPDPRNPVAGTQYPGARISHVFFAHDDVPYVAPWVHPNGNAVFPEQSSQQGWDSFQDHFWGVFFRRQSICAPSWAREMHFDDGRQATVVRLDDLGDAFSRVNTHGFSVVTVPSTGESAPVTVRWFPITR